jgi:hypothetical protein
MDEYEFFYTQIRQEVLKSIVQKEQVAKRNQESTVRQFIADLLKPTVGLRRRNHRGQSMDI